MNRPPVIDILHFLGVPSDKLQKKQKLKKLYLADLDKALKNNNIEEQTKIKKVIEELDKEIAELTKDES